MTRKSLIGREAYYHQVATLACRDRSAGGRRKYSENDVARMCRAAMSAYRNFRPTSPWTDERKPGEPTSPERAAVDAMCRALERVEARQKRRAELVEAHGPWGLLPDATERSLGWAA